MDCTEIIRRALDTNTSETERHQAFNQVVYHYQDMAYGCAYSVLGDRGLAEEAAQEAFLQAWMCLPQLRTPEAFAGWLRRILTSQCTRATRRKHVITLPLHDELLPLATDPYHVVEQRQCNTYVWEAIARLPERDRRIFVLFHINAYTRQEIAAFLGISETTVKRSLVAARKRLHERLLTTLQEDLQDQRPSHDPVFATRIATFTRQFYVLITEGHSIVRALLRPAEQQTDERFRDALTRMRIEIEQGADLSTAMTHYVEYFDAHYIQEVKQGEQGDLRTKLQQMAAHDSAHVDA